MPEAQPLWPDLLLPPILGGVIGGLLTAGAVLLGFRLQRAWDRQRDHSQRVHESRSAVLTPLVLAIEDLDANRARFDGSAAGGRFEAVQRLMFHEDVAYAREAASTAMAAVDFLYAAQQEVQDFQRLMRLDHTIIAAECGLNWTEIDNIYLWHMRRLKVDDDPPEPASKLSDKILTELSEQAAAAQKLRSPLAPLTKRALEELRSALTNPDSGDE